MEVGEDIDGTNGDRKKKKFNYQMRMIWLFELLI